MTALATDAEPPARQAPEAASARPTVSGRDGQGSGDWALTFSRAMAACEHARWLITQSQELRVQARALSQASAERRRTQLHGLPPRLRRDLLQRSAYLRLLAKLATMPMIEQAKGILMAKYHCTEAEAFDLLRRTSQRSNVPVRELAAQIVASTVQAIEADGRAG
jgi:ANTAR domain